MASTQLKELKQKAKLIAKQAGGVTVQQFFEANKASIAAVLPRHVTPDRMLRIAMGALRTTPALMDATVESLMGGVMLCAQVGLEPNTPMGHAYLIPFKNKKQNRTDVQVIFGYKGLIDLARRSGQIVSLSAQAVRENDHFDFAYGLNERLEHIPAKENRGDVIAVYAVAKLKDGGHQFEVMYRSQIDEVMRKSQSKGNFGPWKDHFEEMARKTAIRRLFKYLPVSIEIARAVQVDEVAELGGDQHLSSALEGEYSVAPEDYNAIKDQSSEFPQTFDDPETGAKTWTDANGEFFDEVKHEFDTDKGIPVVDDSGIFV